MKKTVSLLFNSQDICKVTLADWIKTQALIHVVVITDEKNTLSADAFPYPLFPINTLISSISESEECIYRFHDHYRKLFAKKFPIYFKNINLLDDELRGYPFEIAARYMAAYLTVSEHYDHVIFALSESAMDVMIRLSVILKTLRQQGITQQENIAIFNAKKHAFESVKLTFYGYYIQQFFKNKNCSNLKNPHPQPLSCKRARGEKELKNPHLNPRLDLELGTSAEGKKLPERRLKHAFNPCLFITNTASLHRNNFKPVYRKLCEQLGRKPLAIACTQKAAQNAQEDGIAFTSLNQFFMLLHSPKFLIAALCTIVRYVFLKPFYLRELEAVNHSITPLIKHVQKHLFFQQMIVLFSKQGLLSRLLINLIKTEQIEQLLIQHQPTIIYKDVARSHYDGRIAQLAKKYRIPVVTSIVASITTKYRNFGIYPCDFITLLGETQKVLLKKRGYTDKQLICVGQPELDDARFWDISVSARYLSSIISNFQPAAFTILIATSYIDLPNEKIWITSICDYAKQQTFPIQIFLKPHPNASRFYEALRHLPCLTLLPKNTLLYPCLIAANLVITDVSHAGKLALFFSKPLMIVNFSGKQFPFNHFDEAKVAWLASSVQEIHALLDQIQQGKLVIQQDAYQAYIRQHFTSNDGKACDRIVDFLLT